MQAIAKDPKKRYTSANEMFKALRGVVQAATDEEVAEFVKGLLADRLEKRKTAIRAALEIADDPDRKSNAPPPTANVNRPDDVQTVARWVLAHRLMLKPEAALDGDTDLGIVGAIIESTPVPR